MQRDEAIYTNETTKSRGHYSNSKRVQYEHDEENVSVP